MKAKILLLEDDKLFNETIKEFLEDEDFFVDSVLDPLSAYDLTYQNRYDLYIFDINLPFENGLEALNSLRESGDNTPTIFITSRDDKDSLIKGFNIGADDYIKKPFDLDELLVRIEAILRRVKKDIKIELLKNCFLDLNKKDLICNNIAQNFSYKLYTLLELLVLNKDKAVSYEEIYQTLWGHSEPNGASLRVYITKLKKYFPNQIKSIRGYGYIFK